MVVSQALLTNNSDIWGTPFKLYETLNYRNRFVLDAAASDDNHMCERYYTEQNSGLENDWYSWTFCNPPYSQIALWLDKGVQEARKQVSSLFLIPARTDTKWFHELVIPFATYVWFIKGRLCFRGTGKPSPAPFPSMLVEFGWDSFYRDTEVPEFGTLVLTKEERGF